MYKVYTTRRGRTEARLRRAGAALMAHTSGTIR
jgi:hypothetical protein